MIRKYIRTLAPALLMAATAAAQTGGYTWHDPMDAPYPTVQNQGWTDELGHSYHRLPDRAMGAVRGPVWNLSRNSAGLALHFYTDAPELRLRYTVEGPMSMHHMPCTGVSGTDLYAVDQDGRWLRLFGFFNSEADTVWTRFVNDSMHEYHDKGYEMRLYLPLYNGVKDLQVGVPEGSSLEWIPVRPERPVVVYGTSIEQGGVASRPGMAWTTQLERDLDLPLVNLAFSGNGRLEQPVLDLMAETGAQLYILSCLANLTGSSPAELDSLLRNAVATLRAANPCPIIMTEHSGFSDAAVNSAQAEIISRLNTAARSTYEALLAEGVEDIYYVSAADMAMPADAWVDDVHPSDLGMTAIASAVIPVARQALKMDRGEATTTRAVTQRREAAAYEWLKRHRAVMERDAAAPPRRVIIGNSITHFWGGEPKGHVVNGPKTWGKKLERAGFANLGFGWDRIENALWRVHHGELDGYRAEEVVLMIGTNNFGYNTDSEITEGIAHLAEAVRQRQPQARIKVIGILPRRDAPGRVAGVNALLEAMAAEHGLEYADPGRRLLRADGSLDESLFTDGLHPNDAGYALIADEVAR